MIRGATPTLKLTINSKTLDFSEADNVFVTISQKAKNCRDGQSTITKTGDYVSVESNVVYCWLTQKESLRLDSTVPAEIQVNWTYHENDVVKRAATKPLSMAIGKQLLDEVLP